MKIPRPHPKMILWTLAGVLVGAGVLTAGSSAAPRLAAIIPDITLVAGDSLTIHGNACAPRARTPGNLVVVTCSTLTPTHAPKTATALPTTKTAVPTATDTAVPTSTVIPSPTLTPVSTNTPLATTGFPLGIRVDNGDSVSLAAWNAKVRAGDVSHSNNPTVIQSVNGGILALGVGSSGINTGAPTDGIDSRLADAAASNGRITVVDINDEAGKLCPELQSDEAFEYKKFAPFNSAHGTHILMNFAPVGNRIALCGVGAFVTYTDTLTDQVEARQIDANFAAEVHQEIANLRAVRPGLRVAAQVSTLPPRTTTYATQQVISDIDALMDGSPNQPDVIQIFYAGRGSLNDNDTDHIAEADEFITILNHYR